MSKPFGLKIRLQVLVLESSTLSKLIRECKPLVAKNKDSLVEADLLLLAAIQSLLIFLTSHLVDS